MVFMIGEQIKVDGPSADLKRWCRENLVIPNPEYYKKQSLGKWTGNISKDIFLYEFRGDSLLMPFGCIRELYRAYKDSASFEPVFGSRRPVKYQSGISLYSYQEQALARALEAKNGVLVMPCGSGKTQTGLEVIARLGGRALWLTHTQDLLNQSKTRAEAVYGCERNMIGTITAGKVNISNGITFATIQTMVNLDLSRYRDMWDIIIVDECQHCAGSPAKVTQFYKVISALCARYKIGLTATPKRADGLERSMFALLGGIIHEVTKAEVAHTTCEVRVRILQTDYFPQCNAVLAGDGTINYAALIDDLTHDHDRMMLVAEEVTRLDGPAMILANRVEYLQTLEQQVEGKRTICLSGMRQSKKAKAERKEALQRLNDGELDCIFATYALAKEGLDVPNLRYVVLATPEKDETTVVQSAGRVGRKYDGKEYGTVIDFEDNFGMYHGWAKKRRGYYRKLDYHILT